MVHMVASIVDGTHFRKMLEYFPIVFVIMVQ